MPHRDKPRERALEVLRLTETGVFADSLLDRVRRSLDTRDSAFVLELVYGALRNRTLLDWVLDRISQRPVDKTDAWTRNILRLGAYQLLFLDKVPASAAVNTSTELAKVHGKKPGYVNGLLRTLVRDRSGIRLPEDGDPVRRLVVRYSHPEWLVRRWLDRYGHEQVELQLRENNRPAPLVIRTNTIKTAREELKSALAAQGVPAAETHVSPAGLTLFSPAGIRSLPAYRAGQFIVQDEAAQLIGLLLSPRPGETVLDACAAPGGKATHLAELMQDRGKIIALESDPVRIGRIGENAQRLGLTSIVAVQGDARMFREGMYDKILIDAPCSGLGVLRRHPDGRWNKNDKTPGERAAVQERILENCASLLKPGGALVYATCTTEPEENEEVVSSFLEKRGGEFVVEDPRPHLPAAAETLLDEEGRLYTFPGQYSMDGFFGVRLHRAPFRQSV